MGIIKTGKHDDNTIPYNSGMEGVFISLKDGKLKIFDADGNVKPIDDTIIEINHQVISVITDDNLLSNNVGDKYLVGSNELVGVQPSGILQGHEGEIIEVVNGGHTFHQVNYYDTIYVDDVKTIIRDISGSQLQYEHIHSSRKFYMEVNLQPLETRNIYHLSFDKFVNATFVDQTGSVVQSIYTLLNDNTLTITNKNRTASTIRFFLTR